MKNFLQLKKRITGMTLIGLSAFFFSLNTSAYDFEVDGIYYNIIGDNEVEVTSQFPDSPYNQDNYAGEVTIPESVNFDGTDYNVTSIGNFAFQNCSSLESITIPDRVTSIREFAFFNCSSLVSVILPEGLTSIGAFAFDACSLLTSINIPAGLTSIGDFAFYDCFSLTEINIPDGVTSIGEWAFFDCTSLTSINVNENNQYYASLDGVLFNKDLTTLIQCPGGYPETFYNIPDGVTSIGEYAFTSCTSLETITIPDGVTSIEDNTFSSCSSLSEITIPESVTSIGSGAFKNCSSLESINIPAGVISIGSGAFRDCSSLAYVNLPDGLTSIGNNAFNSCTSLESINIPDGVTSIGDYAFLNCSSLTDINISDSVNSIGSGAFWECSSLTEINIPKEVTTIEDLTFPYCYSLTSVTLPATLSSIGSSAFFWCTSLEMINIPEGVTSIGFSAFRGCSSLESVTCEAINVPEIDDLCFTGIHADAILFVPAESVEAYENSDWAQYFSQILPIGEVIPAEDIIIEGNDGYAVEEGDTLQLTAVVVPEDATFQEVVWTSSDESIATVDQTGLVTAIKQGSVIITATLAENPEIATSTEITVSIYTGVDGIGADSNGSYKVYNMTGSLVKEAKNESELKSLAPGLYIINGKKVVVK